MITTAFGNFEFANENDYIAQVLKAEGSWELDICHALFDVLGDKRAGFDIGANVGLFSIQTARLGAKLGKPVTLDAFEVQPDTFAKLEHNIARNNLERSITAHNKAVGGEPGEMEFEILDGDASTAAGCYSLVPGVAERFNVDMPSRGAGVCDVVTLEPYVTADLGFIKIDVEGMELDIIRAATPILREYRPVLLVEIWAAEKADWYRDQAAEIMDIARSIWPYQKQMGENWMFYG